MMAVRSRVVIVIALAMAMPAMAAAQGPPLVRHLEVSGGVGVLGGSALGTQNADLRTNTAGQPYRLFTSTTRVSSAPVLDVRAGMMLTTRYGAEAHAAFGHPDVRTALSSDAEGAPSITAVERLDQYLIDGGAVIGLDELRIAGLRPFAVAGAGYVRQLHEGLTTIEDGRVLYVGGGVRRELIRRPRGFWRALGARGDVRLNMLSGGITIDDRTRRHVAASGSVFVVF